MIGNIHWLGHDSFRIDGSSTLYIDPWKLPAGVPPADAVLITHEHFDHLSPEDIRQVATQDTLVVGPAGVTSKLAHDFRTVTVAPGEKATVGTASVAAVPAYNLDKFRAPGEVYHPREAGWVGYIITMDGVRIYHAGDTDAIPEMSAVECDVALLPVSGTYVMTADEAAEACTLLSATTAVPMHYGEVAGTAADAERFAELCGIPVVVLPLERP